MDFPYAHTLTRQEQFLLLFIYFFYLYVCQLNNTHSLCYALFLYSVSQSLFLFLSDLDAAELMNSPGRGLNSSTPYISNTILSCITMKFFYLLNAKKKSYLYV